MALANNGDFDAARVMLAEVETQVGFVAARGSELAEGVGATIQACAADFTEERYTKGYGVTLAASAASASVGRSASGVGERFMSNLCGTKSQRSMEVSFTDDDSLDVTPSIGAPVEQTTTADPGGVPVEQTGPDWVTPPVHRPGTGRIGPIKPGPVVPVKPEDVLKPKPDKPKEEKKGFSKERKSDR